ncbi:MAG: hypothetical protein PVI28_19310, partial [Gammaproteobacteria bacterium]
MGRSTHTAPWPGAVTLSRQPSRSDAVSAERRAIGVELDEQMLAPGENPPDATAGKIDGSRRPGIARDQLAPLQ